MARVFVLVVLAFEASVALAALFRVGRHPESDAVAKAGPKPQQGRPPLMDKINVFRAELCTKQFAEHASFDKCMKFMVGHCRPGPDKIMDGDPGERTSGKGHCKGFFNRDGKIAEEDTGNFPPGSPGTKILNYFEYQSVAYGPVLVYEDKDVNAHVIGSLEPGDVVAATGDGIWITLEDGGGYVLEQKDGFEQVRRYASPSIVRHRPHNLNVTNKTNDSAHDANPPKYGHKHMKRDPYAKSPKHEQPRKLVEEPTERRVSRDRTFVDEVGRFFRLWH